MSALFGLMLLDMRRDAWDRAERTGQNLLQVIGGDITRNLEVIDLSLRAIVDSLKAPGVGDLAPHLRQFTLFERAVTARDVGVMLVIDENGDGTLDADAEPARRINVARRDCFKLHRAQAGLGLQISRSMTSSLIHAALRGFALPAAGLVAGTVTVSIGPALGPEGRDDTADAALHAAKDGGRNQTRSAPRTEFDALRLVEA